jgi:hypothetical protein
MGVAVGEKQFGVIDGAIHHQRLGRLAGDEEGLVLLIDEIAAALGDLEWKRRSCAEEEANAKQEEKFDVICLH